MCISIVCLIFYKKCAKRDIYCCQTFRLANTCSPDDDITEGVSQDSLQQRTRFLYFILYFNPLKGATMQQRGIEP